MASTSPPVNHHNMKPRGASWKVWEEKINQGVIASENVRQSHWICRGADPDPQLLSVRFFRNSTSFIVAQTTKGTWNGRLSERSKVISSGVNYCDHTRVGVAQSLCDVISRRLRSDLFLLISSNEEEMWGIDFSWLLVLLFLFLAFYLVVCNMSDIPKKKNIWKKKVQFHWTVAFCFIFSLRSKWNHCMWTETDSTSHFSSFILHRGWKVKQKFSFCLLFLFKIFFFNKQSEMFKKPKNLFILLLSLFTPQIKTVEYVK